eukprot:6179036-Pleurochrysis_carterae.AAC.4
MRPFAAVATALHAGRHTTRRTCDRATRPQSSAQAATISPTHTSAQAVAVGSSMAGRARSTACSKARQPASAAAAAHHQTAGYVCEVRSRYPNAKRARPICSSSAESSNEAKPMG